MKKITIDNQQVTDGGRVLLNPASATHNDIASCKATSYVVFLFYAATNLRQRFFFFVLLQIVLQKTEILESRKDRIRSDYGSYQKINSTSA